MKTPIRPNSVRHSILRLLAASSASADDLADALKLPVIVPAAELVTKYLAPLATAGLARVAADVWHVTEAGEHLAARLGPVDRTPVPEVYGPATDLTPHERLAQATPCRPRRSLGTGQSKPPPMRVGALDALALPSRRGGTLYYRDGREVPA